MRIIVRTGIVLLLLLVAFACKENAIATELDSFITVSEKQLEFDRYPESKELTIETNETDIFVEVSVSGRAWCKPEIQGNKLNVTVTANPNSTIRNATITLAGGTAMVDILVSQKAKPAVEEEIDKDLAGEIGNDLKIKIISATASSEQGGQYPEGIERSFDNDFSTLYHSSWNNTSFPVILTYSLESNVGEVDYLVYYPRSEGSNGNFKEFELWVAQDGNTALQKYGDYDFNGGGGRVMFEPALENPTQIQFRVKSGMANLVSCAEMEFYRKDPSSFDYLTIFTDHSCSELKEGVTIEVIDGISSEFFKDLAMKILQNEYNAEFRIQEYKPYPHPDIQAAENKTAPYSLRDNPTGIYVGANEDMIVFVKDVSGQNVSLLIQDLQPGGWGVSSTYPLSKGLNKFKAKNKGLIYVMYHTQQATEPLVKINIATGSVNGYFDSQKHSREDWSRIISKAGYQDFDLLGKYAHLTFPTSYFKRNTPDGMALIDKYDELVHLEHEFMGLVKYDKVFKNRMYFHVDYNTSTYMYATSYRTGFVVSSMNELCSLSRFSTGSVWGPAHEVGHVNQTRPGLRWLGMTEVTNNLHSLYVQTSFGNTSRLQSERTYQLAYDGIVATGIAHNASTDVFHKLVPFWQLKLYLCDAQGQGDFYKDLYEYYRTHDSPNVSLETDGRYQLDFVRNVCHISRMDMTEFFEKWGFLTPLDIEINDYSTARFKITQGQIDIVKAEIAAMSYPTPTKDVTKITDATVNDYK